MLKRLSLFFIPLLFSLSNPVIAQTSFFDKFGAPSAQDQLLADDIAFQILETKIAGNELVVAWESAVDYYLYKKNFKIESLHPDVKVGALTLPKGQVEDDPLFGQVEVYFGSVVLRAPLELTKPINGDVAFNVYSQGCNKPVGVCYPPQKRLISVAMSADSSSVELKESKRSQFDVSADGHIQQSDRSIWVHIIIAFGVGILLVFTPCVLPMIPILSGMVVGHSTHRAKAFWLAVAYVLGTAITYTIIGAIAGAAGIQVQAYFQQPAFIAIMVLILLALSASMFGVFELRLPSRFQSLITEKTNQLSAGGFIMSLTIGLLSALIVSACVSPLLILVLGVAVKQASPVLGGAMMFAMAWGMGIPLILFALGANWLLPKAGAWMDHVKEFFGFAVIAVAIIVASSVKFVPVLFLWSIWLLTLGFWLWRIAANANAKSQKIKAALIFLKSIAVVSVIWGLMSLVGAFYGGAQLTKPLDHVLNEKVEKLPFKTVSTRESLADVLNQAKLNSKPVLVDYYADWCVECVRMEQTTYRDMGVANALKNWVLIKVDVTKVNATTQAAKDFFGVFGPPATLFLNSSGIEMKQLHRYGLIGVNDLLSLIKRVEENDG